MSAHSSRFPAILASRLPAFSATNGFSVVVLEVNSPPILPVQPDRTINELTTLTVANQAMDFDIPADTLGYALLNPPPGASINGLGTIIWTPTEAQGPSTNFITTIVTDNGVPPLSDTNTFRVVNSLLNELAYNPPGPVEGFLYWASWDNHNASSIFSTQDAHGAIRRGMVLTSRPAALSVHGTSSSASVTLATRGRPSATFWSNILRSWSTG